MGDASVGTIVVFNDLLNKTVRKGDMLLSLLLLSLILLLFTVIIIIIAILV